MITYVRKDWTVGDIVKAMTTWVNYPGFSGEECHARTKPLTKSGRCTVKANVFAGGPGWFCPCGSYNTQSWHNHRMPHEMPDIGPSGGVLREGHAIGSKQLEEANA